MKKYRTVFCLSIADLDDQVIILLNMGWELYGSPYAKDYGVCQALTKSF